MAGNFQGWLIKFGNIALPNSFLVADGWESTPNQRVEIDAYRDSDILLHRETSKNFKTKLKLNIKETSLKERMALENVIGLATLPESDKRERKVSVSYWNDETLTYSTGLFYMSDITFTIHAVNEREKDIEYNGFSISLTEY